MKYLSVCSGIEAASVAWHPLGFTPVGFSEIEKFPCSVLAHHYPDVPNFGDMKKFEEWPIEPETIDILVGGTPCQSFSIAGLRGGLEDGRGNLALTYCRILDRLKPRWFVWENVPGVLSSNGGRDFGSILGAMAELGYGFAYRICDAQFYGVPQRRRRVFVVGYLGDWRRAAEVLFEPGCLRRHTTKGRKQKQNVAGTLGSRTTAGGGLGTDFDLAGGLQVAHSLRGEGFDASEDGTGRGTPLIAAAITSRPYADKAAEESKLVTSFRTSGNYGAYETGHVIDALTTGTDRTSHLLATSTGDKSHCLNAGGMGRQDYETETMVVAIQERAISTNLNNGPDGIGCRTDGKAYTLEARSTIQAVAFSGRDRGDDGRGYGREPNITGQITETVDATKPPRVAGPAIGVRRLTPVECERLQGFPDDYTNVIHRGKPAADGPRYKAIGNSMAVPCMAWIGQRIARADSTDTGTR
jgi:DNA (cytosine-5)-methyltransferase 1